jgi:hypothetical protein
MEALRDTLLATHKELETFPHVAGEHDRPLACRASLGLKPWTEFARIVKEDEDTEPLQV